ncbi:hypothetical protein [Microbulbifer aggregans]|uniref:hypothetical protein n=1 Tax=Microbulbifer aggregans TaxID=1769779 RepID=UPI001CFEBA7D|nr:hypothetical protein [Microbulbifer aggregans]
MNNKNKAIGLAFGAMTVIFVAGCTGIESESSARADLAKIQISGNRLIFEGALTKSSVSEAIALVESSKAEIHTLAVSSGGGDVYAAMDFGYWIHRNKIDLVVKRLCFSSCANYLFTAAKSRHIDSGGIVGWHGGALEKPAISYGWTTYLTPWRWKKVDQAIQRDLDEWLKMETQFFQRINVDQKITIYGQQEQYNCQKNSGTAGWTYGSKDLEKMGLKNTTFANSDPDFSSPESRELVCLVALSES